MSISRCIMAFPYGKKKAFTLSYDDGHRCDLRFLDIINKNGLKCTFNLNMGIVATDKSSQRLTREEYSCYEGHEVATHGYTHPFFSKLSPSQVTYEIAKDKEEMEAFFGKIIRGHAYAYGDYDDISVEILRNTGIVYARTVKCTNNFNIPTDWLRLFPTCHHASDETRNLIEKFVNEQPKYHPWLFYMWGHTYEFDFGKPTNNWEYAEEIFNRIGGHEDIWYATNIEIYDYVKAYEALIWSMDGNIVHNPTSTDVFVRHLMADDFIKIPAGSTLMLQ